MDVLSNFIVAVSVTDDDSVWRFRCIIWFPTGGPSCTKSGARAWVVLLRLILGEKSVVFAWVNGLLLLSQPFSYCDSTAQRDQDTALWHTILYIYLGLLWGCQSHPIYVDCEREGETAILLPFFILWSNGPTVRRSNVLYIWISPLFSDQNTKVGRHRPHLMDDPHAP